MTIESGNISTSYMEKLFAVGRGKPNMSIAELLSIVPRDETVEPGYSLFMLRPDETSDQAPVFNGKRLPRWHNDTDHGINFHIPTSPDASASILLQLALTINTTLNRRLETYAGVPIQTNALNGITDVVAGTVTLRAVVSSALALYLAPVAVDLTADYLKGEMHSQGREEVIEIMRHCDELAAGEGSGALVIYDDHKFRECLANNIPGRDFGLGDQNTRWMGWSAPPVSEDMGFVYEVGDQWLIRFDTPTNPTAYVDKHSGPSHSPEIDNTASTNFPHRPAEPVNLTGHWEPEKRFLVSGIYAPRQIDGQMFYFFHPTLRVPVTD
ncbi:hypothetical protein [Sphingobium phenoxybenzoativorans]|uniref:hypothetical protein n=1 Tax=Sphingobium phenoxybenzoativorans TaxID=1592790 RepID=UPI001112D897|nr:hypothetical protein [Sphingobium phenoxybenzoativorans]